jgi:glycerophosphoryl diester phosphodiesterase
VPDLYAHRGAAAELPENTLPAFARAIERGATAIETDCHMTRDGQIVLSHDPTGARMAGVPRAIRESTLEEVRTWDVGVGFSQGGDARRDTFRMPTLEVALQAFPGVRFNVDAKQREPDMTERLVEVIRRAGACERTLIASFDVVTLRRVRRAGYPGPTGLARAEVLALLCAPLRLLRLTGVPGVAAQLPHRTAGIDLGRRALIAKCHALGLLVHYWTVNDPARASELLALGADGIMTDDPRAIAPVFARARS